MGTDPRKGLKPEWWELGDTISDTVVVPCQRCERLRADLAGAMAELKILRQFAIDVRNERNTRNGQRQGN
jgi:hypothetical protein